MTNRVSGGDRNFVTVASNSLIHFTALAKEGISRGLFSLLALFGLKKPLVTDIHEFQTYTPVTKFTW